MQKIYLLSAVFLLTGCSLTGDGSSPLPHATPAQTTVGLPNDNAQANRRLQLDTFRLPSPTPGDNCNHDAGKPAGPGCECQVWLVTCKDHQCEKVVTPSNGLPPQDCSGAPGQWCTMPDLTGSGSGTFCLGKPVVYLYPSKPMLVSVEVQTPGRIVVSDPDYGIGWENVLAYPSGTLSYQGKQYKELYYETAITQFQKPTNGIVIKTEQLPQILSILTSQLGLTEPEQQEFLAFWLPKLQALHSPYVLFSLIDPVEKEKIDHVAITPAPDTKIQFLAYFKPLVTPVQITPLQLSSVPVRNGFTAVEWGGTIDTTPLQPSPFPLPFLQ